MRINESEPLLNPGLLAKAWREFRLTTLLLGIGLLVVEMLLVFSLNNFRKQITLIWSRIPLIQQILRGLLGADTAGRIGPEMITAIAWVHPVILALLWTHAIAYCTRVPAAEVDRGTIDVLLGLPVSRRQLYLSESINWLASGIFLVLMITAGNVLGSFILFNPRSLRTASPLENGLSLASTASLDPRRLTIVSVNLLCLYLAVGGLAWLASALSDRRGRAVGAVLAIILASFLLNYLAQFWAPAETLSFLSLLNYHRPLIILRDAAWPFADLAVLLITSFTLWLAGALIFTRRDLATL